MMVLQKIRHMSGSGASRSFTLTSRNGSTLKNTLFRARHREHNACCVHCEPRCCSFGGEALCSLRCSCDTDTSADALGARGRPRRLGTFCYPCLRAGQSEIWLPETLVGLPLTDPWRIKE